MDAQSLLSFWTSTALFIVVFVSMSYFLKLRFADKWLRVQLKAGGF